MRPQEGHSSSRVALGFVVSEDNIIIMCERHELVAGFQISQGFLPMQMRTHMNAISTGNTFQKESFTTRLTSDKSSDTARKQLLVALKQQLLITMET